MNRGSATPVTRALATALPALLVMAGACAPAASPPAASAPGAASGFAAAVPTPLEHFGHEIGAEGELANWEELTAYYERVAAASPRITLDTLGTSTLGEPFVKMVITSEANHARLDDFRQIQRRLEDPRTIGSEAELERLIEEGRTVVLITSHIHSTEVGAGQVPARLVHRLATSDEDRVREILDETIVVMIPSLNPDGTQMVSDWWREWQGTEYEGAPLPRLYHHYIGHNNNRDWYAFTQKETQLTVTGAHNTWRPQIVHDIHQMGAGGARFFVPPYIDPVEPNVDPLIISALNQLGTYIAAEMTSEGKEGVVVNAIFDIFTPARAYMHYHGGVRILSETAQAAWANPREMAADDLSAGSRGGYDPTAYTWNHPLPWQGGSWTLADVVDYMESGAMALLTNAARNREFWLRNFHEIGTRAVDGWESWPAAWVIPANQEYETGLASVLRILTMGDVEVHRAESAFQAAGRSFPAGSYVVPMRQPFAAFAQTMLERQEYPDLREYEGGPPIRPYDATAHTLPLLMGIEAVALQADPQVALSDPIPARDVDYRLPAGLTGADAPRVGLYRSFQEPMPQGWQRWVFDQYGLAYDELRNEDIRGGNLADRYDVIVFQDQGARSIREGHSSERMPPQYAGGLGDEGAEALREFVERGGRVIAVDAATDYAIETFDLPVRNAVTDLPDEDFYIPGSILRLDLDTSHPIGRGQDAENVAWYWRTSRAFAVEDPAARVVGRYGEGDPRLAGWVLGAEHVAGAPALVEVSVGQGSVVLFGFQPNFRGQTVATWPLLFNALTD